MIYNSTITANLRSALMFSQYINNIKKENKHLIFRLIDCYDETIEPI